MRRAFGNGSVLSVMLMISTASFGGQAASPPLRLQEAAGSLPSIAPDAFGTQADTWTEIAASDFRPLDSATVFTTSATGSVYRNGAGGGPEFSHVIEIPSGSFLEDITAYVDDSNAVLDVHVSMNVDYRDFNLGTNPGALLPVSAASSGTPGNTSIVLTVNSNYLNCCAQIIGTNFSELTWRVVVRLDAVDSSTSFQGVRLRWKRQVSVAPATATFSDVPTTHPFFRYIEALAASGITAGCIASPPQYCPDAPLTRGQMAVFLSRALGLHFPN